LTVLGLLNLVRENGCWSGVPIKKKRIESSFGMHTGHNTGGNVRSLVANHATELKDFNFRTYLKIVKLKGQPIGNLGSGNKNFK
jgi:hypothetical protein